jgi:peptidyl-prolyl cis-trans isomerase C
MSCSLQNPALWGKTTPISVNGVAIARDAIAREAQHHPAPKPLAAWQDAARALVIRQLLLQEARRLGLIAAPMRDDAERRETDEEALIRGLIEREVKTPKPDEESCRRYYMQNRRRFRSPAIYQASHILFAARKADTEAYSRARADAEAVTSQLQRQPERFDELARAYSNCPSAAQGGNLGQISAGQTTPEFERALADLQPGAIAREPVATPYGYHVIRLDRRIEPRELPFELVRERIADYLSESVSRRATAQYIARLVSTADIAGIVLDGAEQHRVA